MICLCCGKALKNDSGNGWHKACDIPITSAEKMIRKIVSMKEKYINMCEESLLPEELKTKLTKLIEERCGLLSQ